jgi:pimeloyl-ACP methyl ester carboxylesterase
VNLEAQAKVDLEFSQFKASLPRLKKMWLNFNVPESDLKSIRAPVLVMGGDRDMVPIEHLVETFHALPHAQLAIFPGTGHVTLKERPEWFVDIVTNFLDKRMPEPTR